jgi:hypothetical protein
MKTVIDDIKNKAKNPNTSHATLEWLYKDNDIYVRGAVDDNHNTS